MRKEVNTPKITDETISRILLIKSSSLLYGSHERLLFIFALQKDIRLHTKNIRDAAGIPYSRISVIICMDFSFPSVSFLCGSENISVWFIIPLNKQFYNRI